MDLARSLQPRDARHAARTAAVLCAVTAVITLVFGIAVPAPGAAGWVVTFVVPGVLLVLAAVVPRVPPRLVGPVAMVVALTGTATVTGLDLATRDASGAAQVFFVLPVLYAASQVRAAGAAIAVVAAAAGHALVVFTLLPTAQALTDAVYLTTTLVTSTVLLVRSGDRTERLVELLRAQADADPLTALATRRVLDDAVTEALGAGSWEGTALVLVDVDAFKAVNDTWGHPVGDDALVRIADCLRDLARPQDVLCRLGGDEFAVLLPGSSAADARERAARVVAAVSGRPLVLAGGQQVALSVSAGVGHAGGTSGERRRLYAAADADLYRAKHERARGGASGALAAAPAPRRPEHAG